MSPDDAIVGNVKLSKPAQRALANAGIVRFADLARWTERDVAALHGIGPTAFPELRAGLAARGLSLRTEA